MISKFSALSSLSLAFSILVATAHSDEAKKPARPTVAVIPKGTSHEFWKTVHAGVVKAERELKVA